MRLPFKRQPSQQYDLRIAFSSYHEGLSIICLGYKGIVKRLYILFAVTKAHSQCGFSIVHKRLWPTRLSHSGFKRQTSIQPNLPPSPPKNLFSYSGRPEYDHVKALGQHLKSVNASRTPITVILPIPVSQASNAFRAREWANGPTEANLYLVHISASRFLAGSFFYNPWHMYTNMAQCASHTRCWSSSNVCAGVFCSTH